MWLSGIVCTLLFLILDKFMWLRSHGIVCQSRFVIEYFNLIWFERCAMLLHFKKKKINSWFYTYFVGDEIEFVLLYKMNCSHCKRNYLSCHEITKKNHVCVLLSPFWTLGWQISSNWYLKESLTDPEDMYHTIIFPFTWPLFWP